MLLELARVGLGDLAAYERCGGDGVGTDAYEVVRDGWPRYVELLGHEDAEVRLAAGYLLAFLVEPAARTLPALRRAAGSGEEETRAGLLIAAARLGASRDGLAGWGGPGFPGNPMGLDAAARAGSPLMRGSIALGQTFVLSPYLGRVRPEVGEALAGLKGLTAGPWGGGDLGALAADVLASLWVEGEDTSHSVRFAFAAGSGAGEPSDDPGRDADPGAACGEDVVADVGEDADLGNGTDLGEDADFGEDEVDDPYTQRRPDRAAPLVDLVGLHDVPWSSLEHAYGPATGVPGMLASLSSPEPADRSWAIEALEACIHHQGGVFSASTAAVPFLVELAGCDGTDRPAVADRHGILVLLAGLAVHQPTQCLVDGARRWQSEAFEAVAAGGPTYVRLLADPDPLVRTAAAYVMSFVEPPAEGALAGLRAALAAETDRRARSSLLLAIGYVSRYLASTDDRDLLAGYLTDPCQLIRVSAAAGLYQLSGQSAAGTGRSALEVLDEGRRTARPVCGFWPWHDGSPNAIGADLREVAELVRVSAKTLPELLADLDAATARGDEEAGRAAADKALWMLFDDNRHDVDHPWLPTELDAARHTVLEYYAAVTKPDPMADWSSMPYWYEAGDLGLPDNHEATRRLLGVVAGPVDQPVEVDGADRPVWALIYGALVGTTPAVTVHTALSTVPAGRLVEIVEDALAAPYRLHQQRRHVNYGIPGGPEAANDYTSRFILLVAGLLTDAGDAGLAWARRTAARQRESGKDRDVVRSLVAAVVLCREATASGRTFDAADLVLLALDQPPASTYLAALREALRQLPEHHREQLVGDQLLYGYVAHRDPRGEIRRWDNRAGWDLVDLLPPATAAERVLAAIQEWERHRAAGDDPDAGPLVGTVTSSIHTRPPPDEPFPRDRATEILAGCGAAAVTAIDAALTTTRVTDRALLEHARNLAAQTTR